MSRPSRQLPPLVALAAACLGLGACGAAQPKAGKFVGEQEKVAKVVNNLEKSGRKRDASAICSDLLAPTLVKQIATASKGSCADKLKDALDDADAFDLSVQTVAITGTTANVVVISSSGSDRRTERLALQKVGAAWKIATLGSAS